MGRPATTGSRKKGPNLMIAMSAFGTLGVSTTMHSPLLI